MVVLVALGCGSDPQTASNDGSAIDAPHVDAGPPRCFGDGTDGGATERLFLNFDGVTLHGGVRDNSWTNSTTIIPSMVDVTMPPFHDGRADRDATIERILEMVTDIFYSAGAAIEITRQRPSDGDYIMVVIGGTSQDAMQLYSSIATENVDCGNLLADDLGLVYENDNPIVVANAIAFVVGIAVGLDSAKPDGNCLFPIQSTITTCAFVSNATSYTIGFGLTCNAEGTPQNQLTILRGAFGCPP